MTPAAIPCPPPPLGVVIDLDRSQWRDLDEGEIILPRRGATEAPMCVIGDAAFLMDTVRAAFGLGR